MMSLLYFFFVALHIDYIVKNSATLLLRYFVSLLCFIIPFFRPRILVKYKDVLFAILCIITGLCNILLIGNSTLFKVLYTVISIGIARCFMWNKLSSYGFLYATYINAVTVFLIFVKKGFFANIYAHASNNYVSIFLLFSCTLYYSIVELKGEKLRILPALVVFVESVIAIGRGGILASGVLLLVVLIKTKSPRLGVLNMVFKVLFAILACVCVFLLWNSALIAIFQRFQRFGMSDHGRMPIWTSYLRKVNESALYALLGAPFSKLPLVMSYENNLHNSFLNIHAFNGVITFLFILILAVGTFFTALRNKLWLFLTCFAVVLMRGVTDQVFWGTVGTPIFLFFLLYF